ncbi:BZ3500_MvSof-1268-A1-R1_Chr10-1g02767 [Microbotryum saponariae]|uniref:BZ3500_MvSof-1268-A1-R1_Chr10-1g02767 protein n=1 Tax=Microbotryum saponariae TaxID=289078 RepID=A0A2X0L7D1_9BASI|nr:BZ3500_MvSof-1268-A1-R1_Chr10-1g02767 [Microbotryum saponariae]SDA06257.1 BZ3501_MvSof-1269-A2-R1_Chr10-1g02369 [Microbotryum saponariae]
MLESGREEEGKHKEHESDKVLATCTAINTRRILFYFTGAHKLQSFGLAGTATKRAKRGYKATTASNWVKVKPLCAKSAAQIKTRRAPNVDSNGR